MRRWELRQGASNPVPASELADAGRVGCQRGEHGLDGGDLRVEVGVDLDLDDAADLREDPPSRVQLRGAGRQPDQWKTDAADERGGVAGGVVPDQGSAGAACQRPTSSATGSLRERSSQAQPASSAGPELLCQPGQGQSPGREADGARPVDQRCTLLRRQRRPELPPQPADAVPRHLVEAADPVPADPAVDRPFYQPDQRRDVTGRPPLRSRPSAC